MGYPNQSCGECEYWLAFGEPETSEKGNQEILLHCAHCTKPCGVIDKEYYKMIKTAQLQILLRKAIHGDI